VSTEQVHVFQIRDGRIAEESVYFDVGGLLRQLQGSLRYFQRKHAEPLALEGPGTKTLKLSAVMKLSLRRRFSWIRAWTLRALL
jgi:hypothetical protein